MKRQNRLTMVGRSLRFGKTIRRLDRQYRGKDPEYAQVKNPLTGVVDWVKVRVGMPYVRVNQSAK